MRSRLASAIAVAAAVLVTCSILTPLALADGDPASDVLLGENVFYPYMPATSKALMSSLNAATATAAKNHFPLKIALIASPIDLGIIPQLLGQPQKYAAYLDVEISFEQKQPLLVVMKNGYGVEGLTAATRAAVAKLPPPKGGTPDDLAQAALTAVPKLASADDHAINGGPGGGGSSGGGSGGGDTALLIILILAAVATVGALLVVRRRQPSS